MSSWALEEASNRSFYRHTAGISGQDALRVGIGEVVVVTYNSVNIGRLNIALLNWEQRIERASRFYGIFSSNIIKIVQYKAGK
jgi:hypothetical protein